MAKRISPTAIGGFVVASLAVLIVALIVAGSGDLFRKPHLFICMFHGDLNGLKVGAPVKARGVQIGSVSAINLRLQPGEGQLRPGITDLRLPVVIDLNIAELTARGASGEALQEKGYKAFFERGLRAQLHTESLLTGLLYIDLDLHPGTPIDLAIEPGSGPFPEIPTVPTQLEQIQDQANKALDKFDRIDFQAMAASITQAASSINELAGSPSLKATLESLKETTANLNKAVISIRSAVDTTSLKIDPLIAALRKNSDEANATMLQTRAVLVNLESSLAPDSELMVHLNESLDQLADTTHSVGELTDFLQRNPSALIRGKYYSSKDK